MGGVSSPGPELTSSPDTCLEITCPPLPRVMNSEQLRLGPVSAVVTGGEHSKSKIRCSVHHSLFSIEHVTHSSVTILILLLLAVIVDIIIFRYIKFWKGYYCRWNPRMRPQDSVHLRHAQLLSLRDQLQAKVGEYKLAACQLLDPLTRLKTSAFDVYFEMMLKQIALLGFSS